MLHTPIHANVFLHVHAGVCMCEPKTVGLQNMQRLLM